MRAGRAIRQTRRLERVRGVEPAPLDRGQLIAALQLLEQPHPVQLQAADDLVDERDLLVLSAPGAAETWRVMVRALITHYAGEGAG